MSINFAGLAASGRAKSGSEAWSPEEWDAVCTLVSQRNIPRIAAADYVRNGITTVEAYDKSKEKDFVPVSQEEAAKQAEETLKENGAEFSGAAEAEVKPRAKRKSKKND